MVSKNDRAQIPATNLSSSLFISVLLPGCSDQSRVTNHESIFHDCHGVSIMFISGFTLAQEFFTKCRIPTATVDMVNMYTTTTLEGNCHHACDS